MINVWISQNTLTLNKQTNKQTLKPENLNPAKLIKSRNINIVIVSSAPFFFAVWLLKSPYLLVVPVTRVFGSFSAE